ncbi:hypothetical protein ACFC9N_11080 [Enterococcus casseliflavus]|uniref:hypothetical protein n=1 Tax=Enterococcus casseliflavus TaxID=37734 RepID=UPI0039A64D12
MSLMQVFIFILLIVLLVYLSIKIAFIRPGKYFIPQLIGAIFMTLMTILVMINEVFIQFTTSSFLTISFYIGFAFYVYGFLMSANYRRKMLISIRLSEFEEKKLDSQQIKFLEQTFKQKIRIERWNKFLRKN